MKKMFDLGISWKELARRETRSFINITFGTLLLCFSITALSQPYYFASGGVNGIALLTNYVWGISPVWVISIGNSILLAWGWKELSLRFAFWTLYNMILTTIALPIFEMFHYPQLQNLILAAIVRGCIGGFGAGMLFREGASSGGSDVVSAVAKKRYGVDIGSASFCVNISIMLLSVFVVDLERVLLSGLSLYVDSMMVDSVLRSFDRRTQVAIISDKTEEIISFIMDTLGHTATLISAKGAYRRVPMDMIMVIVTRRQSADLKRFVHSVDPAAFFIMGDVAEVMGEGFKRWEADV